MRRTLHVRTAPARRGVTLIVVMAAIRAESRLADRRRLAVKRLGLGGPTSVLQQCGEVVQPHRDAWVVGPEGRFADRHRPPHERLGLIMANRRPSTRERGCSGWLRHPGGRAREGAGVDHPHLTLVAAGGRVGSRTTPLQPEG